MVEVVCVQDESSGRIHRRFRLEGQAELASFEADNADSSGTFRELTEAEMADAPEASFCKRCFPEYR